MPQRHSTYPPRQTLRLRDLLLWALLTPVTSAALQQQPEASTSSVNIKPYPSSQISDGLDIAAAAAAERHLDIGADSLRLQQLSGQHGRHDTVSHSEGIAQDHSNNKKKKNNKHNVHTSSSSERALATLSPAETLDSAVRALPAPKSPSVESTTGRLNPRHQARYLQDWQVEDIILLATVDGSLHARDRNNFASKWQLSSDVPMVNTTYHKRELKLDKNGRQLEDPLWIVEPSQDGSIYVYAPSSGSGMQKLSFTVKQLADLAPYAVEGEPAVAYTAEKKTTLYTVDAATGNILRAFSSTGVIANNNRSCRTVNPLEGMADDEECERIGTITLGRTEYIIGIQDRESGEQISTIRYSEWSPNTRDMDLKTKYTSTKDDNYIYTRHDGTVYRLSAKKNNRPAMLRHKFSSPVAQVFDVFRQSEDLSNDPTLIVLPQPPAPPLTDSTDLDGIPDNSIFVNCTESGSWYALSDFNYPDITNEAPSAKCYEKIHLPTLPLSRRERKLFMGVHPLDNTPGRQSTSIGGTPHFPSIDAPATGLPNELVSPNDATNSSGISWLTLLLLIPITILTIGSFYAYQQGKIGLIMPKLEVPISAVEIKTMTPGEAADKPMVRIDEPAQETIFVHNRSASDVGVATVPELVTEDSQERGEAGEDADDNTEAPKKHKASRGKRGGRKQKEKDAAAAEARAKRLGLPASKSVEVISVAASESPQVSGPLQINSLTIHTDKVIGQGSCGTSVFEGSFEGRSVAVKRMLSQYYELASQEVSFLQQSDDHENVIRYYCQQKDDHFLYIAVELCQASLFEVWEAEKARTEERQLQLRKLKTEIQQDLLKTLHQLVKGLHHLHKLRIIHRDIKPQNILVAFPKKFVDQGPRLVISDFGLGKNLPENVSTLIDPTGNAGTSGWKAPELISQPQAESRHSQSTSQHGASDSATAGLPSGVKRAADIFSLGCLFFWMMTDGIHPFEDDNGWTQLRELNIKRDLKKMDVLERWSDAYEPMQLITSMLEHEPESRPTALQVLNHPFFWSPDKRLAFLCDISDHFEREARGVWEDGWAGDSAHLRVLETRSREVIGNGNNFLARLDRIFVDSLGKQRKYSGDRLLDLLRALRNKKNHYEDMSEDVKKRVGPLSGGYLSYWSTRFPRLLMACYQVIHECGVEGNDRFRGYFEAKS